jgi:hypothetical protein
MKYELVDRLWRMHCAHLNGSFYRGWAWDIHLQLDRNDELSYGFLVRLDGYTYRTLAEFPPETVTDAELLMIVQEHFEMIVNQVEEMKHGIPNKQHNPGVDTQLGRDRQTHPQGLPRGVHAGFPNRDYGTTRDTPDAENGIPL